MPTRTLQIVLAGDPSSASRSFKKIGDDAEKMGKRVDREGKRVHGFATITSKGFGRVGAASTAMQAVAGGAVALMAKTFITSASDIEESLSKNRVLFGRFAQDIDKFSQSSAKSFGISRSAALEYTGTFGNLFRATGVAREESAQFSVQLTKLAADMASFNNTSIEDALEAIRSGIVGETEPLRRFGVNLNDAQLRTEALRQGIIRTTKDALTPQQKALAAQALIVKQTAAAHGDFARTQGGLANQTRILKARLADAGAEIGAKLLPAALRAATALNRLITETQQGRGPLAALARAVRNVAGEVSDVVGWFRRHRTATTVLMSAVAGLTAAWAAYKVGVIVATAATKGMAVAQAALTVVMRANPIALVVTAVIGLGVALVTAYKRSARFREIVDTGFRVVKSGATAMADAIKSVVLPVFNTLKSSADKVARGVGAIARAFGAAKGAIGDAADWANPLGDGLGFLGGSAGKSGAGLMGADFDLAPFARIGASAGLHVSSGLRPGAVTSTGNPSFHGTGDAIDMAGPMGGMRRTATAIRNLFGSRVRELISPFPELGVKDGRPFRYSSQIQAEHSGAKAHVHVAYTGPFGDGIGQIRNLWTRAGGSAGKANLAAAVAMAESSGDPRAFNRNSDGSVDRGLWQINSVHGGLSTFDRLGNARAAVRISGGGRDWSPWVAFKSGAYRRFLTSSGGGGGGGSSARPMSAEEAFRQSTGGASIRSAVAVRNARKRRRSPARGPGKGVDRGGMGPDEFAEALAGGGVVDEGPVSDPAAEALAAALEADARAREEHAAAIRENTEAINRQTNFASQAMTSSSAQAWKALADLMSGQIAGFAVSRKFTAGTGVEHAW